MPIRGRSRVLPWLATLASLGLVLLLHSSVVRARSQVLPFELEARSGGEAAVIRSDGSLLITGGVRLGSFTSGGGRIDSAGTTSNLSLGDGWRPRSEHTATALPDGRTLVVGGLNDQGVAADAVLLVGARAEETRLVEGGLVTARAGHTATLLLDGRVLVVGGHDAAGDALASVEAFEAAGGGPYRPETGAFTAAKARLLTARGQHTATLLPDGRIVIVGGRSGGEHLASIEILDPQSGEVRTSAAHLASGRSEHTATLLPDGRVLIAGGRDAAGDLASVEVFDPRADRCESVRGPLAGARANHVAALASPGALLVAGGSGRGSATVTVTARAVEGRVVPTPAAGAASVSLYALVGARLGRPLSLAEVTRARLELSTAGVAVPATVAVAESGLYAFATPDAPLQPDTEYRARLRVPAVEGDALTETVWTFRTRGEGDEDSDGAEPVTTPVFANNPPVVNAGPDRKWNLPVRVELTGIVSDDGLPNPPGALTLTWSKVSGPGTVTFTTPTLLTTSVIISQPGTYTLRLTANDSALQTSDDFVVVVTPRMQLTTITTPDLLWQNRETGSLVVWEMATDLLSATPVFTKVGSSQSTSPNTVAVGYQKVVGIADFNADGQNDILFQNQLTGNLYAWYMSGLNRSGSEQIPSPQAMPNNDPEWMVTATADFNYDGKPDLLLQNQSTGVLQVWFMNGLTRTSVGTPNPSAPASDGSEWKVVAAEDFNGDGYADLLWQNRPTNALVVWYMTGITRTGTGTPSPSAPASDAVNWNIVSTGDFDGNGTADFLWQHRNDGYMVVWWMNGITRWGSSSPSPNRALDTWPSWPVVGNYAWKRGVLPTTLTPPSGAYGSSVLATLSNLYPNSGRYTLDGTTPTTASTPYLQPVLVDQGKTITAQSFWPGWVDSALLQATYSFTVATPTLSIKSSNDPSFPVAKVYLPTQKVAVTCTTPGAVIRYTLTGVDPTPADPAISSGSTLTLGNLVGAATNGVNSLVTLKVKAFKTGASDSGVTTGTYYVGQRKSILYIAANTAAAADLAVKAHLEAMGYTVAMQDDNTANRNQASSHLLVLVAADVDPTLANVAAFWDVSTAMIALEPRLWDDFKMTGPVTVADQDNQTTVNVVGVSHRTAANLSGSTPIYNTAAGVYWGTPGPSATVIARRIEASNRPAFFAYERGARLVGPDTARGQRVATVNPKNSLTAQGWALFDAAVQWTIGGSIRFPGVRFVLGSSSYSTDDQLAIDRLASLGYAVYFSENAWAPTDADGVAAVVLSSSLSDSIPGFPWSTIRNVPYPIVTWSSDFYDGADLSLCVARGTVASQTKVDIVTPTHPLAGGLTAGLKTVTTGGKTFGWCQPNANGIGIAEIEADATHTKKTVFGYEYNAALPSSATAMDRRVGMFMKDQTSFSAFTAEGWKLFDAAIDWATSGDVDGDGLNAREESRWGTNARDADTNDNGIPDGAEIGMGYDGTNPDSDGDGWTNAFELTKGTNPMDPDTDHDGVIDPEDPFPLDPTRSTMPDPTPGLPPTITLVEPPGLSPTSVSCIPTSPCP